MRDAITSPAWGILDDWRSGGPKRDVSIHRGRGYLITLSDEYPGGLCESCGCATAGDLEATARRVIRKIEAKRGGGRLAEMRAEIEETRERLAELERAELEAASSVECDAVSHEPATEPDAAE